MLINPKIGDFERAYQIVEAYKRDHYSEEYTRPRHRCCTYVTKGRDPVAVWHSSHGHITLPFGA